MRLGEANFDDFCQTGRSKRARIKQKSISETKMGAQGDQAAPKAPKLKPKDAQGLPKVLQRHPKIPKVVKICQKWFKSAKNGFKNEPKIVQNRQKNIRRNWNDFGEDI